MVKKFCLAGLIALILFLNLSSAYSEANPYSEEKILQEIIMKVPFTRGLKLVEHKLQNGLYSFKFEGSNPFKNLKIVYNSDNDKLEYIDYYENTFTPFDKNLSAKYSKSESIILAHNLISSITGEKYQFVKSLSDDEYIDESLEKPYIYKLIFKKVINHLIVDNREIVVYIDSHSGEVVKFFGENLSEKVEYEGTKDIKSIGEIKSLYQRYIVPQLMAYKEGKKYQLVYISSLNPLFYGIDAKSGIFIDYKGNDIKEEMVTLDFAKLKDDCFNLKNPETIAQAIAKNLKIDKISLLKSGYVNNFYLTGKPAVTYDWNFTSLKDKILNINVAIDSHDQNILHLGFGYWNYNEKNFRILDMEEAKTYVKEHLYNYLSCDFLVAYPMNYRDNKIYTFYRQTNNTIISNNYITIETNEEGIVKKIIFNWDYIDFPKIDNTINTQVAQNIFIDSGFKLYYFITENKKGKLVYIPNSLEFMIDASTGKKIYYSSLNWEED
ncbi:hypothetical protein TthWC1_1915 [Thermoanaerobacter thermohydrosulfuricus WC1]|uniref:Uncharacterized protein n=1 Tax=Thermoanaerobacter thermohydrosulfuricus WC1 TaxID=1198630 RepID=M8DEV4_THETY|nr:MULTISPECIES: hypothetical protein [Thermoanaerobacter]EMT38572.1 hypothetical protein TthWC1_1915 [Thermoanaerobacter thermohydrosulfuricus WC1]SFE29698.1 hypothetical protein SAMN04324257_01245 [Thermoanaerobacter thermohydrosulfuricus]